MTLRGDPIPDSSAFLDALETLFRRAEAHPDPQVQGLVLDASQAVMHLHHEVLARIVAAVRASPQGASLLEALRADPLVSMLLVEHGLLPPSGAAPARTSAPAAAAAAPTGTPLEAGPGLEARIVQALDRLRPYMHGHGGDIELLGVHDGVARLRLQGACFGCASSALTLRRGVEQVLREAVPELAGIEVEGVAASADRPMADRPTADRPAPPAGFIRLDEIRPATAWKDAGPAQAFSYGTRQVTMNGTAVLLCAAFGRIYAVRDRCPIGGGTLREARLEAFVLVCPCHGERFDLRSGRSLAGGDRTLDLLPVVIERGRVRVAVT